MVTATVAEWEIPSQTTTAVLRGRSVGRWEDVSGPDVEEPSLSARESWVLLRLNYEIVAALTVNQTGSLAPEAVFQLDASQKLRRRPDLAFISAERWPIDEPAPVEAAWNVIPNLVIEIVSPTDLIDDLMSKIEEYFAAGVELVWVVYPEHRKFYVYQTPKTVQILDQDDILSFALIPGFAMPLIRIFRTAAAKPRPAAD